MARILAAALVIALALPARASLLLTMDLPTLAARADHVVVGEVRAVTSEWSEDHRRIYTRIDVDVVETWRTAGPRSMARVSIWQIGGAVGDIELIVPGMPTFAVKERAGQRGRLIQRSPDVGRSPEARSLATLSVSPGPACNG